MIDTLINFVLHIDRYLQILIDAFGIWVYVVLFGIIFAETGLVIAPFFPGDSLLFVAGAFAAVGSLNIVSLLIIFILGAVIGDTVNYWIGHRLGRKVFHEKSRFFKKEYLIESEKFYEKHGGKTIIIARFIPVIRTFAPFVAGIGKMPYKRFIVYNIVGGIAWVAIFLLSGYFFGNIPIVKENLSILIIGIIVISLTPIAPRAFRYLLESRRHH